MLICSAIIGKKDQNQKWRLNMELETETPEKRASLYSTVTECQRYLYITLLSLFQCVIIT